jgi:DNA polymerase-4
MDKYAGVSREIMDLLADFTPLVEPLSIDEAFLDVTASRALLGDGTAIACEIKERIRASVSLTADATFGTNTCTVVSGCASRTVWSWSSPAARLSLPPLPVSRLWGVGRVRSRLEARASAPSASSR